MAIVPRELMLKVFKNARHMLDTQTTRTPGARTFILKSTNRLAQCAGFGGVEKIITLFTTTCPSVLRVHYGCWDVLKKPQSQMFDGLTGSQYQLSNPPPPYCDQIRHYPPFGSQWLHKPALLLRSVPMFLCRYTPAEISNKPGKWDYQKDAVGIHSRSDS